MWIWNTNHSGDFWSKRTCSWKRTWETIHATFLPESMASSLPLSSTTIKLPALSKRDLNFTFNPSSLLYHISEIRFPKNHISFTRSVPKYVPQLLKRVLYKTLYTQIRMRLIENTVLMSYDWATKKKVLTSNGTWPWASPNRQYTNVLPKEPTSLYPHALLEFSWKQCQYIFTFCVHDLLRQRNVKINNQTRTQDICAGQRIYKGRTWVWCSQKYKLCILHFYKLSKGNPIIPYKT